MGDAIAQVICVSCVRVRMASDLAPLGESHETTFTLKPSVWEHILRLDKGRLRPRQAISWGGTEMT